MKSKSMVLLAVAVACGLVAMLGVQQLVSNGNAAAEEEVLVRVLVASTEVAARTPLDDTNTEFKDIPEEFVPEGAVTELAQIEDLAAKSLMEKGDVITLTKLTENKMASIDIPKGMRVVTVSVNLTKTHSGLIAPGDYVDLQVTYQSRSAEYGLVTKSKTFMQNVEVFATDNVRSTEAGEESEVKAKNISLLVTPKDANLLKLAERMGELHLVLRGRDDVEVADVDDVDMQMLEELGGSVDRRGETEEEPDESEEKSDDGDVRSFLAGVEDETDDDDPPSRRPAPQPAVARAAVEPVAEPVVERPENEVWLLEIRAGEETINEQILVPIQYPEDEATPVEGNSGLFSTIRNVLRSGAENRAEAATPTENTEAPATQPTLPKLTPEQEETLETTVESLKETLGEDVENGTIPKTLLAP